MSLQFSKRHPRVRSFEYLEERLNLAGDCLFEPAPEGDAAPAVQAVNCFALDLYDQFQDEQGNLFFSPLSIATGLAMTYAGAAGETATEMADVLHLGNEPGIHSAFQAMLGSLTKPSEPVDGFELAVANSIWPRAGLTVRDDFVRTIQTDYGGEARSLDYSNPDQAEEIINSWVEEKTRGRIKDLIDQLSPLTAMVLTNSVYMKALWQSPFDPRWTNDSPFHREDGQTVDVPTMLGQLVVASTVVDGFQVMEMPFKGGKTSMVFILQVEQNGPNELTPELLVGVNQWLESEPDAEWLEVSLPTFKTTVSTKLEQLLPAMGMPRAFHPGADFSAMTDTPVYIDEVSHKAFVEVTEQGIESAAATAVELVACFAAGTPVLTPEGEKPIEQLKAGDYVLSRNENNVEGRVKHKVIEETFHGMGEIVSLHVGGQVLRVTKGHRFFEKGQGWTPAGELKSGDMIATDSHRWMEVEQVSASNEAVPIYNFRVADHHTYFVGRQAWGFAIWTHNLYGLGFHANRPFHFLIRDNVTSALLFMGRLNDPTQSENKLSPTIKRIAGDANGDGRFTSSDLVLVFQAGKYEDGMPSNASFAEGDWDGDGDFTSGDLTYAFQNTVYERARAMPLQQIAAALLSEEDPSRAVGLTDVDQDFGADRLDVVFTELGDESAR